jgi:hypothetical protein
MEVGNNFDFLLPIIKKAENLKKLLRVFLRKKGY